LIGFAIAIADTHCVGHVAIAVTGVRQDVHASARIDGARAIADAACVQGAETIIHIVADPVVVCVVGASATTHPKGIEIETRTVVLGGFGVEVARRRIGAAEHFLCVAYAVAVRILCASASTFANGIELVAVAITIAIRNVSATAYKQWPRPVANPASIEGSDTGVDVIADAVSIGIRRAASATIANDIGRQARSIVVGGCGVVIAGEGVRASGYLVNVANTIAVDIGRAVATTHTERVELVAFAVAAPRWDVAASAGEDRTRAVAQSASIEGSNAGVFVVANPIPIQVCRTVTTADPKCVELIAVAIAIAHWDSITTAVKNGPGPRADATGIIQSNAHVNVIADAVAIGIRRAASATIANDIGRQARSVVVGGRCVVVAGEWVRASGHLVNVANTIAVDIGRTVATTHTERVELVSGAVAVSLW
jgi:hypothetical protein